MKASVLISLLLIAIKCFCQDSSAYIKVHFLYGSKPKREYKYVESKWFGGIMGGHVGVEIDSNKILNFVPNGKFHVFAKKYNRHSKYAIHSKNNFYEILGGNMTSVKKVVFFIPITKRQKQKIDSLAQAYINQTPYDYALFGMRCASATYEVLAQLGVLKNYSYSKIYKKVFYPRRLRKQLLN
jgi:hypothetical protein